MLVIFSFFLFFFLNISFFITIVFFLIDVFVKYWFHSQVIFVVMKLNLAFYDIFVDPWLFSLFHGNNICWNTFLVLDRKFPSLFVHPVHLSSCQKKFGFFPLLKVCIKPFFHIKSSVLV